MTPGSGAQSENSAELPADSHEASVLLRLQILPCLTFETSSALRWLVFWYLAVLRKQMRETRWMIAASHRQVTNGFRLHVTLMRFTCLQKQKLAKKRSTLAAYGIFSISKSSVCPSTGSSFEEERFFVCEDIFARLEVLHLLLWVFFFFFRCPIQS